MMDEFNDAWDEADIFGGAAAGEDQGVVLLGFYLIERGVESEIMAALFGISLVALEIVDGGADKLARFLAGTDRMNDVADHEQRLEWDHHFVVFDVIANEHE